MPVLVYHTAVPPKALFSIVKYISRSHLHCSHWLVLGWGCSLVLEHLLSEGKALGSIASQLCREREMKYIESRLGRSHL